MLFRSPTVALATLEITQVLDEPSIESVDASLDSVLDAAAALQLNSPLPVLAALVEISESDPAFTIADGISADEAGRAAMEAAN